MRPKNLKSSLLTHPVERDLMNKKRTANKYHRKNNDEELFFSSYGCVTKQRKNWTNKKLLVPRIFVKRKGYGEWWKTSSFVCVCDGTSTRGKEIIKLVLFWFWFYSWFMSRSIYCVSVFFFFFFVNHWERLQHKRMNGKTWRLRHSKWFGCK